MTTHSTVASFPHHGSQLIDVTMDASSNGVWLGDAGGCWLAFDGKSKDGGLCTGKKLGIAVSGCQDLNTFLGRIQCIAYVPDAKDSPSCKASKELPLLG